MTLNYRRIILMRNHQASRTKIFQGCAIQATSHLLADHRSAGQHGDVAQHFFAAITKARGLDSQDIKNTTQLVDNQGRQRLAIDIFRDNHDLAPPLLYHLLDDRQDILYGADLLIGDQDVGILSGGFHLLRVGHEVGRNVPLVDLHTFDVLGLEVDTPGRFNGDYTLFTDAIHHVCYQVTDLIVGCGDRGDLCDLFFIFNGDCYGADILDNSLGTFVNTMLELHRIGTGCQVFQSFMDNCLGQHSSRGGSITSNIVRPRGGLFEQLSAHVLKRVLKLNFFRYRHTIMGHAGSTELLVKRHVATLRTQRRLHSASHNINALF